MATVALAASGLAALVNLPHDRVPASVSARSHLEREQAPLALVDLDPRVLAAALDVIPRDAVYAVVTGDKVDVSTPLTMDAIRPLSAFWLLPRRQTQYPQNAEWVLSFGGSLAEGGVRMKRTIHVADGVDIGEVQR